MKPGKVIFVCLGNICRSPAAEEVARCLAQTKGLDIEFDSAGTYGGHAGDLPDVRMRRHAAARGYDLRHRARRISAGDFAEADCIVAMDDANYDDLKDLAPTPEDAAKVIRMIDFASNSWGYNCVPDPYYGGADGFDLVLDLLEDACEGLLNNFTTISKKEK